MDASGIMYQFTQHQNYKILVCYVIAQCDNLQQQMNRWWRCWCLNQQEGKIQEETFQDEFDVDIFLVLVDILILHPDCVLLNTDEVDPIEQEHNRCRHDREHVSIHLIK